MLAILSISLLTILQSVGLGCAKHPLGLSVSGGGYTAMSSGMAVARALHNLESGKSLEDVTHIGGNSGGSFFANQFLYSHEFFANVTNPNLPMDQIVTDWLAVHVNSMQELMKKDGPLQQEFGSIALDEPESGCAGLDLVQVDLGFQLFSKAAKFPLRWLTLVAAAVLKHSLGNHSAATVTYADMNMTLPVSMISQIALPPDAYTSYNDKAGHTNVSSLHAKMTDGSLIDLGGEGYALPVSFVSDGPGKHGWRYNPEIESLLLAPKCPYKGLFSRGKCSEPPYNPAQFEELHLPKHPLISEITAASGAGTGFAGSPSAYGTVAKKFEDYITRGLGKLTKPLWDKIISCWPYGAQVLSPPMLRSNSHVADAEVDVLYRYLDGGYAENTALPMTISKIQQDCSEGKFDCSQPLKLILVNDGNISSNHTGPSCCTAKDPLKSLFADSARPVGSFVPGMVTTVKVPSQTIFAEPFPSTASWRKYLDFPSKRKVHPLRPHSAWIQDDIKSMQWSGILTTVDNPYFGVRGGWKVHLLVFSLEIPGIIWPGLFDPAQTQLVSPGHLRLADGAVMKDADLIAGHAPMAKAQAQAVMSVLKEFLGDDASAPVTYV